MTSEEQQIWDMVHKFCEDLYINIPDMNRRYLMDQIKLYGDAQRTDGIREGFEAARKCNNPTDIKKTEHGVEVFEPFKYPTADDYLNSKK